MGQWIKNRWAPSREAYAKVKSQAVAYKGGRCVDCKGKFDDSVFEFHHRDPLMKVMAIASMISLGLKLEDLKSELDKCDLVCANCHRLRTNSKQGKRGIRKKIDLRRRFENAKNLDATSYRGADAYDATVVLPEQAELTDT
jgi:5-methylcytosine-specific restriction endonuclease McrA